MPPYSVKDVVVHSYELVQLLPFERILVHPLGRNQEYRYRMKSRNKIRDLAKALYEFDDPDTALEKFGVHSEKSLTHPDAAQKAFEQFLKKITDASVMNGIQRTIETTTPAYTQEVKRKKIQEIIGYTNKGAESVCNIFTAFPDDDTVVRKRLMSLIDAEYAVLWEGLGKPDAHVKEKLVNGLMSLKKNADSKFKDEGKNHV